jgi:hypothetical protein
MDVTRVPGKPAISFAMHEVRAGRVFAVHQVRAGRAGAREDFEEMIVRLVRAVTRPDARHVSADHGGDWGIDVVAGDLNGRTTIWQAKYFMEGVKNPQYRQIEASFATAVSKAKARGYTIERWVLCIPDSLGPAATQWWERWKAGQSQQTGIDIDLWDDTDLIGLLSTPEAAGVRDEYYGWAWAYAGSHGSSHDSQDADKFLDAYRNQVQDWYGYLVDAHLKFQVSVNRAAVAGLDPAGHNVIYIGNPTAGVRGILASAVTALGGRPAVSGAALAAQAWSTLAGEAAERGRTPVLIIDEAHLLDHEQLESIRMLTTTTWTAAPRSPRSSSASPPSGTTSSSAC